MKRAIVGAAIALLVCSCGGGSSARSAVADAGASLGRVRSGTLHLHLELAAPNGQPSARVGFQMDGVFDQAPAGATLPVADLTTVDFARPDAAPDHFVSTGHDAFLVRDGVGYQLGNDQLAPLRIDPSRTTSSGGPTLSGLDLGHWVLDPSKQPPTTVAGEQVDRVTGRVDPVAALNGIVAFAGQLNGGGGTSLRIDDREAEHVRGTVQSSAFEVTTSTSDHLLRSLTARVDFVASPGAFTSSGGAVTDALASIGHLTLTIELRIERPNQPVTVPAPPTIRPISEMPKG